ncbi:type I restriction endonuclease subunit R [Stenotrophomonas sp. Sm3212]|jgi:type I restriction enzyme, R subunit|uniref:type I restriction endonuclease subunit R n=1 Tax=Stenotrophomonas TaxID=40323 RepID=UPI0016589056|nr:MULTISPECIES: type I restriction endonuclease subunit R [Stenotrophomonas]MBC9081264.1 type I restriction endonuclease subunit R [Stenotrophomonas maltophilia]MBC9092491.1 type I restriction endonuclease subunit R [Stenotrophomonas maltophilia]MBH1523030.1 type I restriction endonuclease subunit R [Stenotrophomonas maltophilia]MCF3465596.1 HsdR family type I site-specific deoxyribonuclease [Stenotrophomonas maltophilia]MCF3485293.1 HsdR family type I site-specific deoxyribonuclease [Stenotr
MGWELDDVEKPFVAQLQALGWTYSAGSLDDPTVTGRTGFAEVVQERLLRKQLRALNLGPDGAPWLDEVRLSEAVAAITRLGTHKLMEANERATALLIRGLTVEGLPGWDGGRGQTIRYIDWETTAKNHFAVINQFRVDCQPGFKGGKAFIVPDLVLLVNGIPLVVVECKSPSVPEPLVEAVDQLRRYSNQRKAAFEVDDNEGNEPLFATNQLLVASSFDEARVGCIGAAFEHYAQWKTVAGPDGSGSEIEVAQALGKAAISEQERLIAGLLAPAHLLDVVKNFMLFMQTGGQTIKTVCRYQQYRAVNRAIARLKTGQTRLQHGEHDKRGGIIWHTQGSGKSLTMVFLVRKMRADAQLRRFKVVVITDRKDLQGQLSLTATLTGEVVDVAESTTGVKALARRKGPGLIFATIQKYRDPDAPGDAPLTADDLPKVEEPKASYKTHEKFEVLNEDDSVLVLVDEAHRTQAGDLHANLLAALPNCARIGFTGTPIIMGDKKRSHEIFGEFIDKYTIKEAEADGATVPVLYEGRTANGAIKDGASLDELFEDLFRQHSPEELEAIKKKYATKGQIFDAPALIADKARDILRHYVTNILPNGYKAQVVAYSRLAAIRYFDALRSARDELLAEAQALSPEDKALDDELLCQRPVSVQAAVQAWRYRGTLEHIEFAPIISGSNNDNQAWKQWTDGAAHEELIERFKKPLFHAKPGKTDPLAFLIVKSMLLTGFDAPIEGVMYLDRPIREAELLQAIARVNRTGFGKRCGIVVDYFGVAQHLKEALAAYADEDVEGALASLRDQVPVLRDRHLRVVDLFRRRGIDSLEDTEACVDALGIERLRAEFAVKLKAFLGSLDIVLPRPEGLPYTKDAKTLAYIYARARNRYKDTPVLGKDVGAKVRKLIDDHVISLGIDPKIPPIQLTDAQFDTHVARAANDRAKASEMEHAIRSHIRKHTDEDPVLYRKLSEHLSDILKTLGEKWNEVISQLQKIIDELRTGKAVMADAPSDLPEHCAPFLRTVLDVVCAGQAPTAPEFLRLKDVTVELVDLLVQELQGNRDIWSPHKRAAQEDLNTQLFEHLMRLRPPLVDADKAGVLADKLMEQSRASHDKLVQV